MIDDLCAALSEEAAVPLFATAPEATDAWLLVEYAGRWPAKILEGAVLPAPVIERLAAFERRVPRGRVQFIRRPGARPGRITLFTGRSGDAGRRLHRLELARYEDLTALDLEGMIEGTTSAGEPVEGPLFLVCVHGKRDRCCAQRGAPVFRALQAAAPGAVWQTSHLGGHRFAAVVVALPDGVYYGRVTPADAPSLVAAHRQGRLASLAMVRGRSGRPAPAQAAEHFLRLATGELGLDAITVQAVEPTGEGRWRVELHRAGTPHRLEVAAETGEPALPPSCGKPREPTTRFRLSFHEGPGDEPLAR